MAKKRKKKTRRLVAAGTAAESVNGQRPILSPAPRWAWTVIAFAFALFFLRFLLQFATVEDLNNMDLSSFYSASIQAFTRGMSPYNFPELSKVLEGEVKRTYPYLYPPPCLLLFYPLSLLTFEQAKSAVLLVNLTLVAALAWFLPLRLCRLNPYRNAWMIVLCLGVAILFGPIAQTTHHGQINLLVLSCLLLFWDRARTGHNYSSALFLAIAIIFKTYPAVLLPMVLLSGRRQLAIFTVALLLIAGLGSLLVLPNGLWEEWLFKVAPSGSYTKEPEGLFQPSTIGNQSLNGFFSRLFTDGESSHPITVNPALGASLATLSAGTLVLLTILAGFLTRKNSNSLDKAMLITLPCMYLIAPFSWFHHLVYVLPNLLMLLCVTWHGKPSSGVVFQGLVLIITMTMSFFRMLETEMLAVLGLWLLTAYAILSPDVELPGAATSS